MTRLLLRSRRLFAVGILALLAVVVIFSTATRRPCLHACSGPWRLWKAGHMTKADGREACQVRMTTESHTPSRAEDLLPAAAPVYLPVHEIIPPPVSTLASLRQFRAPPAIG